MEAIVHGISRFSEYDVYLFRQGNHYNLYEKMGSVLTRVEGRAGVLFTVWAPNAAKVSVIGDFNNWDKAAHQLSVRWDGSGIWEGFIPGLKKGDLYKFHVVSWNKSYAADKGDPYGLYWERSPRTANVVWDLEYEWNDLAWLERRKQVNALNSPWSIYELHIGSWRRNPEEDNRPLTYKEIADYLIPYLKKTGFTHVEFMPVMEHPFYGSWGYQVIGYYAPTSRYGTPQEFMYLIDRLHQEGIGVILDWVPAGFPTDIHGLVYYDGTYLYEHADVRKRSHPEWNSNIFNYGRNEVRNFLISNALFWLDKYHIDGLRVDAVASMLYLDYSRKPGEWVPNRHGGREDLEAIEFIRQFNRAVYEYFPDVQTMAEESTAWPMVSRPVYVGGLGFGMKWNMGWMNDTLSYFEKDPIFRKYHHDKLAFSIWYAFTENFVLPLSHDEVVYGKGALLRKMPGNNWQKRANLRLLLGYMFTHPGKKLLFMGAEFGQWREWDHDVSLDWHLLDQPEHVGLLRWVADLNRLYRENPALYASDFEVTGFEWADYRNWEQSTVAYFRRTDTEMLLTVCNFTPVLRSNYRIGVPLGGYWTEVLNSDAKIYGGSGRGNFGGAESVPVPVGACSFSLFLNLPPLSVVVLRSPKVEKSQ